MGLIFRQSLKSSIGFYIGVLLGAINTLFISTQFLTPDELGISRILLENSLIFAAIAHLGIPSVCDRFFSRFRNNEEKHNGFLMFILIVPLVGFILFVIGYLLFFEEIQLFYQKKSPSILPYLWLNIPITLSWTYILVIETYIRGLGRTAIPTFLREVIFRGFTILLVVGVGIGLFNFEVFLYLYVVSMFLIIVVLILYIKKLGHLFIVPLSKKWSKTIIKEMLLYGLIIIIGGIGVNLVLFLDRNIIANQIGTTAVAIFIVASYIASIIEIPSKSIRQITGPILATAVYERNTKQIDELYKKSALNLMLIGGIMLLLISCSIENVLSLLPKSDIYLQGKWIVIVIGLAKWIDMSLGLNNELISFSSYFRYNTYLYIFLAVLAVFANYFLIPIFGVLGSALATASISLLSSIIRFLIVRSIYQLNPFHKKDLIGLGILLICFLVGYFIPSLGTSPIAKISTITLKSTVILLIFSYLLIKWEISDDVTKVWNLLLQKIK